MESSGAGGPDGPEENAPPVPPRPSSPPRGFTHGNVELIVSKHVLQIGTAAYPLHNITKVHTFELRPDRAAAVLNFLKWLAICGVAFSVLGLIFDETSSSPSWDSSYDSESSDNPADALAVFGFLVLFGLVINLIRQLSAPTEHVLAVETASSSVALVTLPEPERLPVLRELILDALENPATGLVVRANRVDVNPRNYHFGDTVNMYGGIGNQGVRK
ncbi:DUF6232 family protein [Streptomyces cavernicola]|uniref:DUF6232 family protein n=1 Tax=Streptomyces cavernicola TaxID=3043613 RepID=A0ABT6S382_9ACTN|nr:DUF6232 family protein [Streptomyces sp. B-S-A6]MDI3402354.1 DUF6232 family protein [Streptomyces sp. B-S-A6]